MKDLQPIHHYPLQYHECFHIHCLLFGDFIQLWKYMLGIKIVKTVAINLLASIDPS
ncbi:hypothetical protein E2C01_033285 [Portunus trituberculatus]|uniref:Uncharacterized protein n=1 Tax=Portunus trituberculatus TaxID=210409 RepID=A0A5B7F2K4_PORTR|nr:hypothetical protein [Portunus trituberculatus]